MVKLWVAALPTPLPASTTPVNVARRGVGVPEIRPAELSVRPLGSVPGARLNDGAGEARGRVLEGIGRAHGRRRRRRRPPVNAGAWSTTMLKLCGGVAADAVAGVDDAGERLPASAVVRSVPEIRPAGAERQAARQRRAEPALNDGPA